MLCDLGTTHTIQHPQASEEIFSLFIRKTDQKCVVFSFVNSESRNCSIHEERQPRSTRCLNCTEQGHIWEKGSLAIFTFQQRSHSGLTYGIGRAFSR